MNPFFHSFLLCSLSLACCASNTPESAAKPAAPAGPKTVRVTPIGELNKTSAANSHADETGSSRLELDFRTRVKLGGAELGRAIIAYPRVKQLRDGRFLLVYQGARIGADIYYALSDDGIRWEKRGVLFARRPTVNGGGEADELRYSSADAIVLRNGDILAISPFRCNKGYYTYQATNGISLRRSADNGQTWGEEQVIFTGTNWEPYALQLPSGEIHIYFTDNDPAWRVHDSGVSLLRSTDNGHTWTQQCHIIRQYRMETSLKSDPSVTKKVYTDQMPAACRLDGSGKIMVALESMDAEHRYFLSFAWSDDNWSRTLTGDQVGPAERLNNAFAGCAPYLAQFRSGETLLSYNIRSFFMRMGNPQGTDFPEAEVFEPFGTVTGYWGAFEIIDDHTVIATVPDGTGCDAKTRPLLVGRLRLNHRIDAPEQTLVVDGDNRDWSSNTDAFFLGSQTQAQVSFRFAHDSRNVYVLAECLDADLTIWDRLKIMLSDGTPSGRRFDVTASIGKKGIGIDRKGVAFGHTVVGTLNDQSDADEGYVLELAIPKKMLYLEGNRIYFNADLTEDGIHDTFTGLTEANVSRWLPVVLN